MTFRRYFRRTSDEEAKKAIETANECGRDYRDLEMKIGNDCPFVQTSGDMRVCGDPSMAEGECEFYSGVKAYKNMTPEQEAIVKDACQGLSESGKSTLQEAAFDVTTPTAFCTYNPKETH
ncbi:hypothetical protein ACFL96_04245 [Thermoproteota archaeon]